MNKGNIYAGLQIQVAPTSEPITMAEAETQLRLVSDGGGDTDTTIGIYITVARKIAETVLRRPLLQQQWMLALRNWPGRSYQNWPLSLNNAIDLYYTYNYISLPFSAPLISVDSITYLKSDGTTGIMTNANKSPTYTGFAYNVFTEFEPARVVLPYSAIWPTDILMPGAPIKITYTVGYVDVAHLKNWEGWEITRQAMMLLIADCWENRIPPDKMQASGKMSVIQEWLYAVKIWE